MRIQGDQVRLVSFGALVVSSIDALGFFCAKQAQEAGFDALAESEVSVKQRDMRAYRPDVTEQKKLYSLLLSLKRARSKKPIDPSPIKSNSEPWIAHPKSLADVIAASESVEHSVDEIRPK